MVHNLNDREPWRWQGTEQLRKTGHILNDQNQDTRRKEMQDPIYPARRVLRRSPEAGSQETLAPRRDPDLRVRPASSEDEQGLRRMFSRLSSQSIYLRFHI